MKYEDRPQIRDLLHHAWIKQLDDADALNGDFEIQIQQTLKAHKQSNVL